MEPNTKLPHRKYNINLFEFLLNYSYAYSMNGNEMHDLSSDSNIHPFHLIRMHKRWENSWNVSRVVQRQRRQQHTNNKKND